MVFSLIVLFNDGTVYPVSICELQFIRRSVGAIFVVRVIVTLSKRLVSVQCISYSLTFLCPDDTASFLAMFGLKLVHRCPVAIVIS